MAEIGITVSPKNGIREEDGPHFTADGKVFFCLIVVNGVYDPTARPSLIHNGTDDLFKKAGIKYVKNIEWFSSSPSGVGGATGGTGKYKGRFMYDGRTIAIIRTGLSSQGIPTDESEIGAIDISGINAMAFEVKITGD